MSDGRTPERLAVAKTYKLYLGGAFQRSESGRVYPVHEATGGFLANAARASRKDVRDAVSAARKAFAGWSGATPYNRGQVIYRIAEVLEGRRAQFTAGLRAAEGLSAGEAEAVLDTAIDRLQQATGHIQCDDIDRLVEKIRLAYNDPESPLSYHQNAEYYKLCHRQLLITKQKATILYICNDYQWDTTWEPWLHHAFYYGMECKAGVFKAEIESWIKRQHAALTATPVTRSGPRSELADLPQTFTLDDIVTLKRNASPTDTDEALITKAKTLIRTWKMRRHIIPTEQEGVWEKC